MEINKYLKIKNFENGYVISKLLLDLNFINKYKNILFIRTPTTGAWLDKLFTDDNENNISVIRILYDTKKIKNYEYHKSTIIIDSSDLEKTLNSFNKKFDLICIDPFHEFTYSKRDLDLSYSFLENDGIILSHDCYPITQIMANPTFIEGSWCGETYLAYVKFAYEHPELFYGIINIDTGIGIISKCKIEPLKNNLDIFKQETLLIMHEEKSEHIYSYFNKNSKELVNSFSLND